MTHHSHTGNPEISDESLFENMLDGLAYCRMLFNNRHQPNDFVFLEVNKNYETLTGMKNVVGKQVTALIPDIQKSNLEMLEAYGRVSITGKSERLETYVPQLKRWFLISVYRPRQEHFIAIFQNITERKQIEQELQNAKIAARNVLEDLQIEKETLAQAKAKDEAMLSSIGEGLVTTDPEGKVLVVNQAFEQILGWKLKEIRGTFLQAIVPMRDEQGAFVPEKERLTDQCVRQKKVVTAARYYQKKDGSLFPVFITAAPMMMEREFLGVVQVFRDISKETDIDRAKTEFVSLASHQLKTPLTTIGWYAEMLLADRAGTLAKKDRLYAEKIAHNNRRMVELVNALLNVSRIDMGSLAVVPQPIRLQDIAESVLEELAQSIQHKVLQIHTQYAANLPAMTADPQLIRIIFQNLLSNAVKYSLERGTVSLTITMQKTRVLIHVSDTGFGIPASQQSHIFTKLFRADNAREKDTDGTGLGLYIAKAVVEESGGKIWFTSTENKGTDFFVTLPIKGIGKKRGTKGLI